MSRFRPTAEDLSIIEANRREGEETSDVIRRAIRLLDREAREERARQDMRGLRSKDPSVFGPDGRFNRLPGAADGR